MLKSPLYFYVPEALWPRDIPSGPAVNWSGFALGIYAWTIQTYLYLRQAGQCCQLVKTLPAEGIVFLHRNAFRCHPQGIASAPRRFLVCLQGDLLPHPDAQMHVVQNPAQAVPQAGQYFVPHWPQPGLLPRSPDRGDRCTTVAFFGHGDNLAPELLTVDWQQTLAALGLDWQPRASQNQWHQYAGLETGWNDYRAVDIVVAARSFNPKTLARQHFYRHKPATKLYNAWLAGVPAILGPEVGYRAEQQSSLDYIEAQSVAAMLQALKTLKANRALRQAMATHGQQRARAITPEAITDHWVQLIQAAIMPAYDRWCRQARWRQRLTIYHHRITYGAQRLWQRWDEWQYSLSQD